jgi:succinoglycan biosynthesis transport protein ExoP
VIPGKRYSPEDVLRAAWRRKWAIVCPALVVATVTVVGSRWLPAQYRSEALIQLTERSAPDEYLRTSPARAEDRNPAAAESRLISVGREVMTSERLQRVIVDLNLYRDLRSKDPAAHLSDRMRQDIVLQPIDADTFRLGFRADSALQAERVTTRLMTIFTEEDARQRVAETVAAADFLQEQVDEVAARLDEQEKRLEAYRAAHSPELPGRAEVNLQAQAAAERQLQALIESDDRDRNQVVYLQRQHDQIVVDEPLLPPSGSVVQPDWAANVVGSTTERLEAARASLKAMQMRLTAEHPDVVNQQRLVARLEKQAEAESTDPQGANARPKTAAEAQKRNRQQDLQAQIELLNRQIASRQAEEYRLRQAVAEYRARVDASPRRETDVAELTRDYDTQQKRYSELLGRRDQAVMGARLQQQSIGQRFKVLEEARVPAGPEGPTRMLVCLVGLLAGLLIGAAVAAFIEYRDSSLRTEEDVTAALGFQVLAMIPQLESGKRRFW